LKSDFIITDTPIEVHSGITVKREDMCCPKPAPSFSKVRGIAAHLEKRKEEYIGVLDTFHSKAGWGVSYVCQKMNRKAVVFYPVYKGSPELQEQQERAEKLGAVLIPLPAGRSAILYHRAKKILAERFRYSYMLPNALKLSETVAGTCTEVLRMPLKYFTDYIWVVSISSGTIGAGVLRGLTMRKATGRIIFHMGYSRSRESARQYILRQCGLKPPERLRISFIDEKYNYKDAVDFECPFPCNEYYDLKAWKWLCENKIAERAKIMFWNIGE